MSNLDEAYRLWRVSKYKHQLRDYTDIDDYIIDKECVSLAELVEYSGLYCGSVGHYMAQLGWMKHKVKGKIHYSSIFSSIASCETSSAIS